MISLTSLKKAIYCYNWPKWKKAKQVKNDS